MHALFLHASSFTRKLHSFFLSHSDGELWALDVPPSGGAAGGDVCTVGEDNKIIIWDAQSHRALRCAPISSSAAALRRRDPRAATSSCEPQERCARAVAFSPNGEHLAIGLNNGCVNVYNAATMQLIVTRDLNAYGKPNNNLAENWIQDLKYNPEGSALAVGTHGSVIVLLDVASKYGYKEKLKAHNASVAHLDWSTDGRNIQSSCVAYELIFHTITDSLTGSKQQTSASAVKNVQWVCTLRRVYFA